MRLIRRERNLDRHPATRGDTSQSMRPGRVLVVACVLASAPAAARGRLARILDARDGLAAPSIASLAQDPRGFLWIGSVGGLLRYDGQEVRRIGADVIATQINQIRPAGDVLFVRKAGSPAAPARSSSSASNEDDRFLHRAAIRSATRRPHGGCRKEQHAAPTRYRRSRLCRHSRRQANPASPVSRRSSRIRRQATEVLRALDAERGVGGGGAHGSDRAPHPSLEAAGSHKAGATVACLRCHRTPETCDARETGAARRSHGDIRGTALN
jgi:hypothetical protein